MSGFRTYEYRVRESAARLAEGARAENWSHEEYLVACLQREVSARESHGGEGRIRTARFAARKSLEEFDFDLPPGGQNSDTVDISDRKHGRRGRRIVIAAATRRYDNADRGQD